MDKDIYTESASFSATMDTLYSVLTWVRSQIVDKGWRNKEIRQVEIALEEAFVNIIHYAYPDREGVVEITCLTVPGEYLELILKDSGIPFDPLKKGEKIDYSISPEERKEGGLGILLMKKLVDELQYRREGKVNILILKKYCVKTS